MDADAAVLMAFRWERRQRASRPAWILSVWARPRLRPETVHRSPALLGDGIAAGIVQALGVDHDDLGVGGLDAIVIEAPYVSRKNPGTSMRIARFGGLVAGGVLAGLANRAVLAPDWPPPLLEAEPVAWRGMLGLSAPDRDAAKAKVLAGIPVLLPGIVPALAALGASDDVADAAGIALVGVRLSAWMPGFDDRLDALRAPRRVRPPPR